MSSQARNMSPPGDPSPLRHRPLGRAFTFADPSRPLRHRRSSNLSESLRSSTDDLLRPRARSPVVTTETESSHWHSVPLALALFPAIGGLFFHNGSVIVTDLTLLVLAAVFLNWAVRLPWDWYLSAQTIHSEETPAYAYPSDTIIEEGSEEEEQAGQPSPADAEAKDVPQKLSKPTRTQHSAASELRAFELIALSACFVSPAIGAWLLHHIRSQLSRPSEGLVSNYNLTIFLLASEIRPMTHLIKMVQARTLYLQRVVATNPHTDDSPAIFPATIQDLASRLADLETHVVETTSNGATSNTPNSDTIAQVRKSVQPDLDALNRAVRRYEKRATVLSLQTESRLQELESRLGDAITLAAAAERSSLSNRQRRGSGVGLVADWIAIAALLPFQIGWSVVSFPGRIISGVVTQVEDYVGLKIKREMKTAGKVETRAGNGSGSEKKRLQARGQKKLS